MNNITVAQRNMYMYVKTLSKIELSIYNNAVTQEFREYYDVHFVHFAKDRQSLIQMSKTTTHRS